MSTFSTQFPIDARNNIDDVISVACDWIGGSPHTSLSRVTLDDLRPDLETTFSAPGEQFTFAKSSTPAFHIGGVRHVRLESDLEWTTTIVALKEPESFVVSIQVVCAALRATVRIPPPKKPYFIRQILSRLKGGMDGEIPLSEKPFFLKDDEANIGAALITGEAKNSLPIIYVSSGFDGGWALNPIELSRILSGMAHIVVEPSRAFSFRLRKLTESKNAFGGSIGIYWPDSSARNLYFPKSGVHARALLIEIAKDVRKAISNRRQLSNCTWTRLTELLARKHYEGLKAEGSTVLDSYIEAFDKDQGAKDALISELQLELARRAAEIKRLSLANNPVAGGLLLPGIEQDFYKNERLEIIVQAIQDALRSSRANSRRDHVLRDFLSVNEVEGNGRLLGEEIKSIFKTYREMDAKTRADLTKLGFDITEDGKHYKATFQGDGRYTFSISKSSSDVRAGKNLASDIAGTLL